MCVLRYCKIPILLALLTINQHLPYASRSVAATFQDEHIIISHQYKRAALDRRIK